jgi:hypothetical protein
MSKYDCQDEIARHKRDVLDLLASGDEARALAEQYRAALEQVEPIQQRVLETLRREGFKFETPLHLSEGWEKLAFSLYSTLCEVDAIVRHALDPDYLDKRSA